MPRAFNNGGGGTYARADVLPLAMYTRPAIDGMTGAYIFTAGESSGLVNLVPGGVQPTEVGSVIWANGYAEMSRPAGYLDTGLAETLDTTIIFVGKRAAAAGTPFIGNYIDATQRGVGVYSLGSGSSMTAMSDRGSTTGLAVTLTTDVTVWRLYSATIPAAAGMTMTNHTTGETTTGTQVTPRVIEDAGTIKIGAFNTPSGFNGVAHIAAAMIFNRVLTSDEMSIALAWARQAAAFGQITV